jgi:hypothetical protein
MIMALDLGSGPLTAAEAREGALERAASIKEEHEEVVRGRLWEEIRTKAFMDGLRWSVGCFEKDACDFVRDVLVAEVAAQGFDVEWDEGTGMITVRW